MNILLVDDDQIARLSLANIVSGIAGVATAPQAQDGEQAWALLQAGMRPTLCCCDIRMPNLDGLGLLQRIRAHPVLRHIPVVLISSASDRETVQAAISGGVAGYILKPFLAQQTRATLERVLRERLATDAEPVHATRRRLALDDAQLAGMLDKLHLDAIGARQAADDAAPMERVERLHSGALLLGLWRSATLLHEAIGAAAGDATLRSQVLDEVARLVQLQRRALAGGATA